MLNKFTCTVWLCRNELFCFVSAALPRSWSTCSLCAGDILWTDCRWREENLIKFWRCYRSIIGYYCCCCATSVALIETGTWFQIPGLCLKGQELHLNWKWNDRSRVFGCSSHLEHVAAAAVLPGFKEILAVDKYLDLLSWFIMWIKDLNEFNLHISFSLITKHTSCYVPNNKVKLTHIASHRLSEHLWYFGRSTGGRVCKGAAGEDVQRRGEIISEQWMTASLVKDSFTDLTVKIQRRTCTSLSYQ